MPSGVGTPKAPVANNPRLRVPQIPAKPWTATAPIGSSIRQCSRRSTPSGTTMPATAPMEAPPEAGPEGDGAEEGDEPADRVDDRGAGEVTEHGAVGERVEELRRHVAEPAARPPDPVTEDRVDEARHGHRIVDVAL